MERVLQAGLRARGAKDHRPGSLKIGEEGLRPSPRTWPPPSQKATRLHPLPRQSEEAAAARRAAGSRPAENAEPKKRESENGQCAAGLRRSSPGARRTAALPAQRVRPGSTAPARPSAPPPPLPRLPAPPPPPKPLWELRAARSREAGALERRGGAALPASPPARAAPQPGAYSPPPPPPSLSSWPPARPSRRRADAGPLPRGRSRRRRRRRPARPAAAAASGRVRRMPRPLGPPTRSRLRLQRCRDAARP
ncbi:serine/arginine repetitive matrix protein 1-like [Budorcas taxicolor]|uniref:serine/arginine repetitive matrix protein 1-like n=1 Tax=Budorcas taxicolor TaxID=37181 RepID=UPI00228400ED|nr:serine/arginine repetitive matrix protein 1-like [Budorcas taxicolor]